MKVAVISNTEYSIPVLQLLISNGFQASVFTDACFPDPSGGKMLQAFCSAYRIPCHPTDDDSLYSWIHQLDPSLILIFGYSRLIHLGRLPVQTRKNIYNIHFGELPHYRGPVPLFWQIKQGEPYLGCTIHLLDDGFDTGSVAWFKRVKKEPHVNYGIANVLLSHVAVEGVSFILQRFLRGEPVQLSPQNRKAGRYYKRPELKDVSVRWKDMSAPEIVNLIQACNPWNKGATAFFKQRELKLLDAEVVRQGAVKEVLPGVIEEIEPALLIGCKNSTVLKVNIICLEGAFIPSRHVVHFGLAAGLSFD